MKRTTVYRVDQNSCSKKYHTFKDDETLLIFVDQAATFHLICDDTSDQKIIDIKVIAQQEARIMIDSVIISSQSCKMNVTFEMQGQDSNLEFHVYYALDQEQKFYLVTDQQHIGYRSKSDLRVKGLLQDSSMMSYTGLIHIKQEAAKTHAQQSHINMTLSEAAFAISIPSIEVLNNDVACYHASAMGKFDKQQELYLQSRGFDILLSQRILIEAFFLGLTREVVDQICQKMIRK